MVARYLKAAEKLVENQKLKAVKCEEKKGSKIMDELQQWLNLGNRGIALHCAAGK